MTTESKEICFDFKGDRAYVQGADLVNQIVGRLDRPQLTQLKFTMHGFIENPDCVMKLYDQKPQTFVGKCRGSCQASGDPLWFEVIDNAESELQPDRVPFNESQLTEQCELTDNSISLMESSPFSFVETIVSMNKFLLQQTHAAKAGAKWIFTGLELDRVIKDCESIKLAIVHNFQNKLVKTAIECSGEPVGIIYFSMVKT